MKPCGCKDEISACCHDPNCKHWAHGLEKPTPSVPDSAAFADKTFELVMQCCQPSSYPGTSAASAVYEDVRNAVKEVFEAFGQTQYERGVNHAGCQDAYRVGFKDGIEKAADIAKVSADYYSKNMKREDGTFNTTVGSAAQTSWDIHNAILYLLPPSEGATK